MSHNDKNSFKLRLRIHFMSFSRVYTCLCNFFVCKLGRLGSLVALPLIGTI